MPHDSLDLNHILIQKLELSKEHHLFEKKKITWYYANKTKQKQKIVSKSNKTTGMQSKQANKLNQVNKKTSMQTKKKRQEKNKMLLLLLH